MVADPLFYALAIPAVVLMGLSKGGFSGLSMLSLPLVSLAISPVRGAAILLPILMVQDIVSLRAYWRKWDRPNVAILLPSAFVGIVIGYLVAALLPDGTVDLFLGLISIVFGLKSLIAGSKVAKARLNKAFGYICGVGAGFTSMLSNTGAPLLQIFLMPQKLPRDSFVGTQVLIWTVVNWIKIPPFIALGQLTWPNLSTSATLFPLALASTWAGIWLVRRMTGEGLYTVIAWLLLVVGSRLVWQGTSKLLPLINA